MKIIVWITILAIVKAEVLQPVSPGILKEELGKVALLNREAEVWIKVDLAPLRQEIDLIDQLAKKLMSLCSASSKYLDKFKLSCENLTLMAKTMIENLHDDYDKIFPKRGKRNILEYANIGVKVLFGAIEHFDKKNFEKKLESLRHKQEDFNFELSELIEKNIAVTKNNSEIIKHHEEILEFLNTKMEELIHKFNFHDFEVHTGLSQVSLQNIFNAMYSATDNKIRDLHQGITDLQNNVLNTKLIGGYETIINALKKNGDRRRKIKIHNKIE